MSARVWSLWTATFENADRIAANDRNERMFEPAQSARHYVAAASSLSSSALVGHHCQPSARPAPPGGCRRASSPGGAQRQARWEVRASRSEIVYRPWAPATPDAAWRGRASVWSFPLPGQNFPLGLRRYLRVSISDFAGTWLFFSKWRPCCLKLDLTLEPLLWCHRTGADAL